MDRRKVGRGLFLCAWFVFIAYQSQSKQEVMGIIPALIISAFIIWVGVMTLFFPAKTRSVMEKMFSRKPTASESEIRWGMRIGGFMAVFIGASVFLMYCFGFAHG